MTGMESLYSHDMTRECVLNLYQKQADDKLIYSDKNTFSV